MLDVCVALLYQLLHSNTAHAVKRARHNYTVLSSEKILLASYPILPVMANKLVTVAMKALWLLSHYIALTTADQASDTRPDGLELVEFAKAFPRLAFPRLQNLGPRLQNLNVIPKQQDLAAGAFRQQRLPFKELSL